MQLDPKQKRALVVLGGAGLFGLMLLLMHRGAAGAPPAPVQDAFAAAPAAAPVADSSYPPTFSGGGDQSAISELANTINSNDSQLLAAIGQLGVQTTPVASPADAGNPTAAITPPENVTVNVTAAPVPRAGPHTQPGAHKGRSPSVPPHQPAGAAHPKKPKAKPKPEPKPKAQPKPQPKPKPKSRRH